MHPAPRASGRQHLPAVDGLRFAAALHIVLFHTVHIAGLRLVNWGSTSTSMFFVLSGFVLAWAYAGEDGRMRVPPREFWWRRLARLYPLSILSQLAVIPFVWERYAAAERTPRAVAVLTGTQGWFPAIADSFNSPGWSVTVFVFCYLAFPFVLRATHRFTPRALAVALGATWLWCILPAAVWVLASGTDAWLVVINHHPFSRFPEFLFGLLLARLLVTQPGLRVPRATTAAAVALLAGALMLLPEVVFPLAHNGLLAPLHALLIAGVASGRGLFARILSTAPLRQLGTASFAVFLLHVPIYAWLMMPLAPVLGAQPLAVRAGAYLGYLVLTCAAAWAVQRWIADPIAAAIARWRGVPPAVVARPAPLP